jgi:hypothetical protein
VVATTLGLSETLVRDWPKAARFYVRCGVTKPILGHGVASNAIEVA